MSEWKIIQLRHLLQVTSGATPESGRPEYWDGEIFWITPEDVSNVTDGYRLGDTRRKITQEGYASCGTSLVPEGSVVLTKRAPIGQVALLNIQACSNQGCFLLTQKRAGDSRFFYYVLLSQNSWLNALGRGSTFMELSTDDLKSLRVSVPDPRQQKIIADFLDRETGQLRALITAKEKILELLVEKRQMIIGATVTRGLNPRAVFRESGIPWLGEVPEHWPLLRAKFLWREVSLPVRDTDEMVTCFRDGQVTLRRNRREEGFTNAIKELGYQGIREGQLVLHSMDAFAGAIGVSDSDGKCTPEYIICEPVTDGVFNPYFGHLLRVMALNGYIQAVCSAVRERAPRIHFSDFGDMLLPLPPYAEQQAIVAHVSSQTAKLDNLRLATERAIDLLKERCSAIVTAVVTGELEVN